MSSLYYLLDQGDFCFLSVAVLILMWLGQYMVRGREDHRRVGLCAGAASFLIFAICGVIMNWPLTSEDLVRVTLRALTAGGMFLGIGWILASVLGVAFQQSVLRLWRWNQERLRRQQTEAETTPEETEADQEDVIDLEILEGENLEAQERREELILHLETVYLQHREELKDRFSVEELEQSLERLL